MCCSFALLHRNWHIICHFGDVFQANLLEQLNLTQKSTHSPLKRNVLQLKTTKKLKPGLVTSYDVRPGNGEGLFWFSRFINLSLTYLLRHLPTYLQPRDPHGACRLANAVMKLWCTLASCQHTIKPRTNLDIRNNGLEFFAKLITTLLHTATIFQHDFLLRLSFAQLQ